MHAARGSNWKLVVLILVLVLVVAILGFLCVHFFLNNSTPTRTVTAGNDLPTQVAVYDARGKDVTDDISVTAGTLRPDSVDGSAEMTLIDVTWAGKKDLNFPVILTVTDSSFPNNDGLAVYHFADGAWQQSGPYLIEDHTVAFQVDSLSPFAFQVISSKPEPTATPEPTPEPIDYGQYDRVQVGEFVQANAIAKDGVYVIAYVDDPDAEAAIAGEGDVTFFDIGQESGPYPADILINYNGTDLKIISGEVTKRADGRYVISTPVVEGMLWTAADSDPYMGHDRYALANNMKYLNLDDAHENVVLNDNALLTRWLYGAVMPEEGDSFTTMSYQISEDTYFIGEMAMVDTVTGEGTDAGQTLSFTVTSESDTAKKLVIFQSSIAQANGDSNSNNSDDNTLSGLYILTGTPAAVSGLDATPSPTDTPAPNNNILPVENTSSGGNSGGSNTGGDNSGDNGTSSTTPPAPTEIPIDQGTSTTPPPGGVTEPGGDDSGDDTTSEAGSPTDAGSSGDNTEDTGGEEEDASATNT